MVKLINQNDYEDVIYVTKTNKPDYEKGLKTTIKDSGCGICCGMMVAQFFNEELSLNEAIKLAYDSKANTSAGTKYKEYANALAKRFNLYIERSDKLIDLYRCLDEGGCCVVNVGGDHDDHLGYFSHIGHYIFIETHKDNELVILDPGVDPNKYQEEHRKVIKFAGERVYADAKYLMEDIQNREFPLFLFKKNKTDLNYETIFKQIDNLYAEFVERWKDVVNIQSNSFDKSGVDEVEQYFLKYAASQIWYYEELVLEKAGNVLSITMNPLSKEKPIVISGHMDTVHKKDSVPIYIKDGNLYGPGASDCKGGLLICLLVMKALKNVGYNKRPIKFLLQSDEEVGSSLSNKQSIEWMIKQSKDARCFINTEMNQEDSVVIVRKGICRYEVLCKGISSHASSCNLGASAIKQASHIVIELEKLQDPNNITISCGKIEGGAATNVVPDTCKLSLDVRYNEEKDKEIVDNYIRNICSKEYVKGCSAVVNCLSNRPAMTYNDTNRKLVEDINVVMKEAGLKELTIRKATGGSDAAYISLAGIASVDSLGVRGGNIHSPNEYAVIESLKENAYRLAAIIVGLKD